MSEAQLATAVKSVVFISYSHDSPKHQDAVLKLAQRLRGEGVFCDLDQFYEAPPEGWPRWMMNQIEHATYILVISTENYDLRFRGKAPSGVGKGANWEGAIITQQLFNSEAQNTAFIPVVFKSADAKHIPLPLQGATYYDLSQKVGFIDLLRRLTDQLKVVPANVAPKTRRLTDDSAELDARQFDKEIATDLAYYTAKLGNWPTQSFSGEEVIGPLQGILDKVEANPAYREQYRNIWATLYRMIGGAYLLHSKLEMGDKLRAALAPLRTSLELWPDQQHFAENVGYLEKFFTNSGGNIQEYLTTVLQIVRGPADPQIPTLVEQLSGAAQSIERQAQAWLLNQATPNPIWNFLEAVQLMLKKERKIDAEIEVSSQPLPNGDVEVKVDLGPNIFLWNVDFNQRSFEPANQFTRDFMGIIDAAKA